MLASVVLSISIGKNFKPLNLAIFQENDAEVGMFKKQKRPC